MNFDRKTKLTSMALFLLLTLSVPALVRAAKTGAECSACHTVYSELTPFGQQFKLRDCTLGELNAEIRQITNLQHKLGHQSFLTGIKYQQTNRGV